jgi:hypothetical protein
LLTISEPSLLAQHVWLFSTQQDVPSKHVVIMTSELTPVWIQSSARHT